MGKPGTSVSMAGGPKLNIGSAGSKISDLHNGVDQRALKDCMNAQDGPQCLATVRG